MIPTLRDAAQALYAYCLEELPCGTAGDPQRADKLLTDMRAALSATQPAADERAAPAADVPVVGYLFSRPGISKIDVAPHGGEWEKLVRQSDHRAAIAALQAQIAELGARQVPIDIVLHCPACGLQHIDEPEELPMGLPGGFTEGSAGWTNPPHRSHLCHGCGHIWRPADVPTNGVAAARTRGKNDSGLAAAAPSNPTTQPPEGR